MNCAEFGLWRASEDPAERSAAAAHAADCAPCAARLAFEARLAAAAAAWRETVTAPPPELEARVLAATRAVRPAPAATAARAAPRRSRRGPGRFAAWAALAAASAFGVAMLGVSFRGPAPATASRGRTLLVADALAAAEEAERMHAAAIARLARAAEPVLARAADPATMPREAALLLAYRDRLRDLDRTIDEIEGHLARNAGNPTARALLLAAYTEKSDVLGEILALGESLERGVS